MLAAFSVISLASFAVIGGGRADSATVRTLAAGTTRTAATTSADIETSTGSLAIVVDGVLATAKRHVGTRYVFGGTRPGAFDCSGFVRYVFARHGVPLPRTAREQATAGHTVIGGLDSLRVGDLLFFRTRRGRAAHVAIYAGGSRIIHASAGSRRVRYDDLGSTRGRWFITHLSGVRRVIDQPSFEAAESVRTEHGDRVKSIAASTGNSGG
jgi:cell wall-associated NlpC family hydrolase